MHKPGKDEKRRPEGQDDVPFRVSAAHGEFLKRRLTFHKAHLGFSEEGTGPRRCDSGRCWGTQCCVEGTGEARASQSSWGKLKASMGLADGDVHRADRRTLMADGRTK